MYILKRNTLIKQIIITIIVTSNNIQNWKTVRYVKVVLTTFLKFMYFYSGNFSANKLFFTSHTRNFQIYI